MVKGRAGGACPLLAKAPAPGLVTALCRAGEGSPTLASVGRQMANVWSHVGSGAVTGPSERGSGGRGGRLGSPGQCWRDPGPRETELRAQSPPHPRPPPQSLHNYFLHNLADQEGPENAHKYRGQSGHRSTAPPRRSEPPLGRQGVCPGGGLEQIYKAPGETRAACTAVHLEVADN